MSLRNYRLQTLAAAAVVLGVWWAPTANAAAIEVEAALEPARIGVGQLVTLTLRARKAGMGQLELDPRFALDNLEIAAGPSRSIQMNSVNGRISNEVLLRWRLHAVAVGEGRVSDLQLKVNGELFELDEQTIVVQEEPVEEIDPNRRPATPWDPFAELFGPRRRAPAVKPKILLRSELSNARPFAGQQIIYSLVLYTQTPVYSVDTPEIPDLDGFWAVAIDERNRQAEATEIELQGERFRRHLILRRALYPLRPGPMELGPASVRAVVRGSRRSSWFDPVRGAGTTVTLHSEPVRLSVEPLPTPPPGYHGAVGDLKIDASLQPQEVQLGEASTLTVRISGSAQVDGIPAPSFPESKGLRIFPPERNMRQRLTRGYIRGEKTWSYILVPETAGAWDLPSPEYLVFDPTSETYRTVAGDTLHLTALPTGGNAEAPSVAEEPTKPQLADKNPDDRDSAARNPKHLKPAVLATLAFAVIILFVAQRFRGRYRSTARLRVRLRDADNTHKPREAAQEIESAWREYLAQRWEIDPAVDAQHWAKEIAVRAGRRALVPEFEQLAADLHYLRYAPELAATDTLRRDLIRRSLRLSKALR